MAEIICRKCSKKCKSLQGWKMHMTSLHGGYDNEELQDVAGISPTDDVRSRMSRLADRMPGEGDSDKSDGSNAAAEIPPPPAAEPAKRIKATPKKLKKILGDIPAQILKTNGIALDNDDEEAMEEAAEFLAGVFGVEFAVPESKYVIQSR